MGSVQKLATVVIVGLVALSTIIFLYLGDEDNRIDVKGEEHQSAAVARAEENYIALCLQCHGPAGEGYTEPGSQGTGRIGAPLGGINTSLNQEGINAAGTPYPGGVEARAKIIHDTIYNGLKNPDGTYRMPAFGGASGSLTDAQIDELVVMIQNADWNQVYNLAVEESGGFPTPPPGAAAEATEAPDTGTGADGESAAGYTIESHDIFFTPDTLEIPANMDVTIALPNLGMAPHNFSIDALGISIDQAPGENLEVVINAPAGEYEYYCNIPGHREAGMVGTLTVTEGLEGPAANSDSGSEGSAATEASSEATGADAAPAEATGETVTVVSHDIYFEPTEVTISADTDVTFVLPNEGAAPHNFSIDELGISIDQTPGESYESIINAPAGEYEFYCNVPGHREAGMVGTLIVE